MAKIRNIIFISSLYQYICNNLNNTYIQFYDYDTDKEKNNEKTFYAKIKIVELIDMLSKHETINNLYKVKKNVVMY